MAVAIPRHYELLDEAIVDHGGVRPVEQGEGDSVVGAFSRASDAVAAAVDAQRAFAAEPWPEGAELRVRMAVHTGEAQLRDERQLPRPRAQPLRADPGHRPRRSGAGVGDDGGAGGGSAPGRRDAGRSRRAPPQGPRTPRAHLAGGPSGPAVDVPAAALARRVPPQPAGPADAAHRTGARDRRRVQPDSAETAGDADRFGRGRQDPPRRSPSRAEALDRYPGGVWWVELAPLADPNAVGRAALAALGAREAAGTPVAAPARRSRSATSRRCSCWTTASTCIAACAELVAELLVGESVRRRCWPPAASRSACPARSPGGSRRCAARAPTRPSTSRPCRSTTPLACSSSGPVGPGRRSWSTTPTRPPSPRSAHRLDGIPLAIELAAARCRQLSAERIAAELDDRFRLLTGGARTVMARQQTLAASVDWSHDRLDEAERITFRRLGVFAGPFPLEAAEAVVAADGRHRPGRGVRPGQPPRRQEPRRRRRRPAWRAPLPAAGEPARLRPRPGPRRRRADHAA